MTTVTLDQLVVSPKNMRKFNPDSGDDLVESIREFGIIQPLTVICKGDKYEVIAGARRLAALRKLQYAEPIPVHAIQQDQHGDALWMSLIENFNRRAPHDWELWEAVKRLSNAAAYTPAMLAKIMNQPVDAVKRAERLGKLHPDIFDALKNGYIDNSQAKAYAAVADKETQRKVFENPDIKWPADIKKAYGFSHYHLIPALKYVGKQAYKDAGGCVDEDLFSESVRISDEDLLFEMKAAKQAEHDAKLAKRYGIQALSVAPDMSEYRPLYQVWASVPDELTERYDKLVDAFYDHENGIDIIPEDNLIAMREEREAIEDEMTLNVPFNELSEVFIHHGGYYGKLETLDGPDPTEDKDDPLKLTATANSALALMRTERRADLMEKSSTAQGFDKLLFAFARSLHATMEGANKIDIANPQLVTATEWMVELDDQKAWAMFMKEKAKDLTDLSERLVAAMIFSGCDNKFLDEPLSDDVMGWKSTEEFWALFRKKEQLLARIEEFSPHMALALANSTSKRIRELAHQACSTPEAVQPTLLPEADWDAAVAWIPQELRFDKGPDDDG